MSYGQKNLLAGAVTFTLCVICFVKPSELLLAILILHGIDFATAWDISAAVAIASSIAISVMMFLVLQRKNLKKAAGTCVCRYRTQVRPKLKDHPALWRCTNPYCGKWHEGLFRRKRKVNE